MSDSTMVSIGFIFFFIVMLFLMFKKFKSDDKKEKRSFDGIKAIYPNVSTSHKENTHTYNILWMLFRREKVAMLEAHPYIGVFWYTGEPHNHHEVGGTSLEDVMSKRPRMPLQHLIINKRSTSFHVVAPSPYIVIGEFITNNSLTNGEADPQETDGLPLR